MFRLEIDEDLALELLHIKDADKIYELGVKNRDELKKWLPWVEHNKSAEDTKDFIVNTLRNYAIGRDINCSIVYGNEIVGNISLFGVKEKLGLINAEIGYWLDANYQGRGIMTKAVVKMLEIGFLKLNVNKVTIECAVLNCKSCNVAKRLGFKREGTIRAMAKIGGVVQDFNVYSILRSEWQEEEKL